MIPFSNDRNRGVLMKKSCVFLLTAIFVVFAAAAYSQSLADLAKQEKVRRKVITDDRTITREEADKYRTGPEAAVTADDQTSEHAGKEEKEPEDGIESPAKNTDPDEPVDFEGRPESYWRKTMADARKKVQDLENEANVLILKQNSLQNDFYREDDGFKREGIQREIQKTYYEQDLNKENLEKARASLQDLENEARKSGALPGWISAKNP
jgi:hypothetical protein